MTPNPHREAGFTPGPWAIRDDAPSMIAKGDSDIAEVCDWWPQENMVEAEANRNLIAAAPELYEALEWIAPLINRVWNENRPLTQADLVAGRTFTMNRALAKARGESA
jgi:hypothetical protein